MSDLSDIQAAGSIKIIGSDSSGLETNPVNADSSGNLQVIDASDGSVVPGTVASKSSLAGGQYNSTPPTLTNGQQSAIQLDSSGRLIAAPSTDITDTGSINALNGTVVINTADGHSAVIASISGTWLAALVVEGDVGDGIWYGLVSLNEQLISQKDITQNSTINISCSGYKQLRIRANKYTSGTVNISWRVSDAVPATVSTSVKTEQMSSFVPDPCSVIDGSGTLSVDSSGNLIARATCLTDEGSFRDDFTGSSLTSTLIGTAQFVNGSTLVAGIGTLFSSECLLRSYIKLTTDSETFYSRIINIDSDSKLYLESPYLGSTGSGTVTLSKWITNQGAGTSIVVGSSNLTLNSGTNTTSRVSVERSGDYLPCIYQSNCSISQRIANQSIQIGLANDIDNPVFKASFVFEGTASNTVRTVTWSSATATDKTETTINFPTGANSSQNNRYEIDCNVDRVDFLINGKIVASHRDHIPGPYDVLNYGVSILNSGAVTTTAIVTNFISFNNQDRVQTANSFTGDPAPSLLYGTSTTGLPIPLNLDSSGNLIVTQISGFGADFSFGDITTSALTRILVRRTAYTEQSTNAQRQILSSSAADTAAGTGARTVKITYLDQTGAGPFTETLTLNGTTAVNTVNTNICYIEQMEILTAGSGGVNAGTITLRTLAAATIGTIAVGDNQTFWCHHYVPVAKTCNITGISSGHNGTTVGSGALFTLNAKYFTLVNSVETQISDFVRLYGQTSTFARTYSSPIKVVGPARIQMYVTPETSSSTIYRSAFDFFEQ